MMWQKLKPYLTDWFLLWAAGWFAICAIWTTIILHDHDWMLAIWFAFCMGLNQWIVMEKIKKIRRQLKQGGQQ